MKRLVTGWVLLLLICGSPQAQQGAGDTVTVTLRDTALSEVMAMLAETRRVNILIADGIEANVSLNLYDVSLDTAVRSIARAAGLAVEREGRSYFLIKPENAGRRSMSDITKVRTFRIQYANPTVIKPILDNYLSSYGTVTAMPERNILVVEETPEYLAQIAALVSELDSPPKQILIEARILEVSLNDSDTYGINWAKLFNADGGSGSFGIGGLPVPASGAFFSLVTPNVELALDALKTRDRVRTLSSPKLLALENQQASVVIGERQGYKVTTTINQVTTESIEFLESGVILKVLPRVDGDGRVMLDIHPEVSSGSVSPDGVPSQTTTEVSTQMLANDGQTIFIGGLIKNNVSEGKDGVQGLSDVPLLGKLFSSEAKTSFNTETVVLITPYIVGGDAHGRLLDESARVDRELRRLRSERAGIERRFSPPQSPASDAGPTPTTSAAGPVPANASSSGDQEARELQDMRARWQSMPAPAPSPSEQSQQPLDDVTTFGGDW